MKRKLYFITALASLSLSNSFAQYPTNGLVEYYSFNNTLAAEIGPVEHDFVAGLQPEYTSGIYNGSNHQVYSKLNVDNVLMTNDNISNFPTGNSDFTISFWLKLNVNSTTSIFNYTGSASPGNSGPNSTDNAVDGIYMSYDSDNLFIGTMNAGTFLDASIAYAFNFNWHHITLAHTAGNTSLFIDGVGMGTNTSAVFNIINHPNATLRIGQSPGLIDYGVFDIDEFLIYNRYLTTAEITTVMNSNGLATGVGMEENDATKLITSYPNPTSGVVNIEVKDVSNLAYNLYSSDNREVMLGELNAGQNTIDMQELAAGTYFLKTTINGSIVTKKINKQ